MDGDHVHTELHTLLQYLYKGEVKGQAHVTVHIVLRYVPLQGTGLCGGHLLIGDHVCSFFVVTADAHTTPLVTQGCLFLVSHDTGWKLCPPSWCHLLASFTPHTHSCVCCEVAVPLPPSLPSPLDQGERENCKNQILRYVLVDT